MGLLSFPLYDENFNHEFAIRRFCPAAQIEEGGEWEEILNELVLSSPSTTTSSSTPCLSASEVDDFVDSIINMDLCDNDDSNKLLGLENQGLNFSQDEENTFIIANDSHEDAQMMIKEMIKMNWKL